MPISMSYMRSQTIHLVVKKHWCALSLKFMMCYKVLVVFEMKVTAKVFHQYSEHNYTKNTRELPASNSYQKFKNSML